MGWVTVFLLIVYIIINLVMSKMNSAKEMRKMLVDGQNPVGMVASNLFYAPAWFLKVLRKAVIAAVK